jgi:DNA-directed RNA polymerase subunit alpha
LVHTTHIRNSLLCNDGAHRPHTQTMHISLPSQLKIVSQSNTQGVFEIEGLAPGYGYTLANSLRRIILSSIPGAAIIGVHIDGVQHEFSSIEGVKEDVIAIILNLKKVRLALTGDEPIVATLSAKAGKVTAANITTPGQLEVMNPDQYICEITDKSKTLNMTITVASGLGYVPREMHTKDKAPVGVIALDASFTPIQSVSYEVENMRVGDRVDYNRLRMNITTDGSISPEQALHDSLMIMMGQFKAILDLKYELEFPKPTETVIETPVQQTESVTTPEVEISSLVPAIDAEELADILKTRIDSVSFSTRTLNALSDAGIRTIGGLIQKTEENLLELPGFGQKGLGEVREILAGYGLGLKK